MLEFANATEIPYFIQVSKENPFAAIEARTRTLLLPWSDGPSTHSLQSYLNCENEPLNANSVFLFRYTSALSVVPHFIRLYVLYYLLRTHACNMTINVLQ